MVVEHDESYQCQDYVEGSINYGTTLDDTGGHPNGHHDASDNGYHSYLHNNWTQIAEATLPLKASKMMANSDQNQFQASVETRSEEISRRLIVVNLVSMLINLLLALVAFYFSFVNNSPSTTAFAADCVLDFISNAIVLWRYYGDLNSVYMNAREQIACIYLGALFEISALAIIVKASSDMASFSTADLGADFGLAGYDLVYLASAATVACSVLTIFKCALYKTIRDKSILLDVINTLISTVFAMSIIMSQALINVNRSFWYLDPVLSIMLALFMAAFGFKVIHQNFNILRPMHSSLSSSSSSSSLSGPGSTQRAPRSRQLNGLIVKSSLLDNNNNKSDRHYGSNLNATINQSRANSNNNNRGNYNWQKTDYSTISFV